MTCPVAPTNKNTCPMATFTCRQNFKQISNHTVETNLIHINIETHHIYLIKMHNTSINNNNNNNNCLGFYLYFCFGFNFLLYIGLYIDLLVCSPTYNFLFFLCILIKISFMYTIIYIYIFFIDCPLGGLPKPTGLWGLP